MILDLKKDDYNNVASRSGGLAQLEYAFETPKLDLLLKLELYGYGFNDLAPCNLLCWCDLSLVKYSKGSLPPQDCSLVQSFYLERRNRKITDRYIFLWSGPCLLFQSEIPPGHFQNRPLPQYWSTCHGLSKQIGVEIEPFHSDTFSGAFRIGILNENGDVPCN